MPPTKKTPLPASQIASKVGQRVSPTGAITYDFDGHIHADGIDLDASDSSAGRSDRMIRWTSLSGGGVVGEIYSWDDSGTDSTGVEIYSNRNGSRSSAGVELEALVPSLGKFAKLNLSATPGGSITVDPGSGGPRTILTEAGASDFLQLQAGTANRKIAFGTGTTPAMAAAASQTVIVATGFANSCVFFMAQVNTGSPDHYCTAVVASPNGVITVKRRDGVNFLGNVGYNFIALGN